MSKVALAWMYRNSANKQLIHGMLVVVVLMCAIAPPPNVHAAGPTCQPADGLNLCDLANQLKANFGIFMFVGLILVVASMLIPIDGFLQNFGINIDKNYIPKAVAAAILLGGAVGLIAMLGFEGTCGNTTEPPSVQG